MEGPESKSPTRQEDSQTGPKISGSESPPDDALKVKETKDSGMSSVNKSAVPPVSDDALKIKETKDVVDESATDRKLLEDELTKLNQKFLELQKQVSDLKVVNIESQLKIKTVEEELETSKKSLSMAKAAIANLKGEQNLSASKLPMPTANDDALKVGESKDFGSESSVSSDTESSMSSLSKPAVLPVDDALKAKETECSGSESSMPSVSKPAVPPVNDDALKVEETKDPEVLLQKISKLEEELVSLIQKRQSLAEENGELKQKIKAIETDVRVYLSESKLGIKSMEEQLEASEEFAKNIEEQMSKILEERSSNQSKHDSEIKEMIAKMTQYMTEISQLKSTHENNEKTWNDVTGRLKKDLKEKSELVDELIKKVNKKDAQLELFSKERRSQDTLIQQLKTEVESIKSAHVGLLSSFDLVQKITVELKLKVVELEKEVKKQREGMPDKE